MKCQKCGFDNPPFMKFCGQCGAAFPVLADHGLDIAKSILPEAMKNKILAAKIAGERKVVTVLFADVTGYTALSEKLDPEELRELINRLFKELIEIIYKYEGTIDKFIGDCIMALFGASITHEDDPERACHAALEIMQDLDRFNENNGTDLAIHIGVNSGGVVTGAVGSDLRMDYTVMGDTVNLASRLLGMAKQEILVSESIFKGTSYLFEMQALPKVAVRGKTEMTTPYRLINVRQRPERKRGIPGIRSALVGRNEELATMKLMLDNLRAGQGGALSIIGDAGIGKSRLIEELPSHAGDRVSWLKGRCFSYDKTLPYSVFLEQVRAFLGTNEMESETESRKRLVDKTKTLFGSKLDEYLAYLCLFLRFEVPDHLKERVKHLKPNALNLDIFVSIKTLFRKIAQTEPLILYFEDMHWVDPESLDLIVFLLDSLKNDPILFIFETRPERETGLFRIRPALQGLYKRRYCELALKPLADRDVETLIQNILEIPGFPKNVVSIILEKSEGNPFYIEEIIHSFIDSGIIEKKDGQWRIAAESAVFEVPDTVEAVIRSRIDRLTQEPKEVLGNASVIGRSFPYPILFCTTPTKGIERAIQCLEQGEFITNVNTPEPMFKHILVRDVAYNGLLLKQRREMHRKTAQCIEEIHKKKSEEYYEIIAYHYYNAEILDQAYDYYKMAADKARELYENDVAIKCYTRAIELHEKLFIQDKKEMLAELLENRGEVKRLNAEYDAAIKDYEKALNNYANSERKAEIKRKIGGAFRQMGNLDKAIAHCEEAIALLKHMPGSLVLAEILIDYAFVLFDGRRDYKTAKVMAEQTLKKINPRKEKRLYARCLDVLGGIAICENNLDQALKYHEKALAIFTELNDKLGMGVQLNNIGIAHQSKMNRDKALRYFEDYLALSEIIGSKAGVEIAANNAGVIYKQRNEFATALKYFKMCFDIAEEIGSKRDAVIAAFNIGSVYDMQLGTEKALEYFRLCLERAEEINEKMGIGRACVYLGDIHTQLGKLDEAERYLQRSKTILSEIGDEADLLNTLDSFAELHLAQEDYARAREYAEKALAKARELGAKDKETVALRVMARVISAENLEQAIFFLEQSIALARKEKIDLEVAESEYELARILKMMNQTKEVEDHVKEAKKIYERYELNNWVKKTEELLK